MIVKCHRPQLDYFRAKARNTPNEILAYLIGSSSRNAVVIERFAYPPLLVSTPSELEVCTEATEAVKAEAAVQGLQIIGDIHSHPNWAPVMSGVDYSEHKKDGHTVCGIVEVTNRRTRVCFWQDGTPLPCTLEYL